MLHELALLLFMARGGGGGSGGGGGGGGGGGFSGGGSYGTGTSSGANLGWLLVPLGIFPANYVARYLRRKLSSQVSAVAIIGLTIVAVAACLMIGTKTSISGHRIVTALAIIAGSICGYFGWLDGMSKYIYSASATKKQITEAAALDAAWDAHGLESRVTEVFQHYQADWSSFDTASMKSYMSDQYYQYNLLMMRAMQQRQRQNNVANPRLISVLPTQVIDSEGSDNDAVTFSVYADANDQLIDTSTNQTLFTDNSAFTEYWSFVRHGNEWLLDHIDEATADTSSADPQVQALATANGYFYSLDWGWLLLPQRGDLFKDGKFGKSDINNHVIGVYRDVLIELYSFVADASSRRLQPCVIAQAALPKRYDSLIVKAKTGVSFFERVPKGYNKLSLEWPDFNKRYTVYATNAEQVTAFELLHPVYMEKLFALPFKVSIEVVDNVVYLYSRDANADYGTMLSLLKDAFEEMKL